MKRDMDLVRELLLRIEADPDFDGRSKFMIEPGEPQFEVPGHSFEEVIYHLQQLIDAGYIDGDTAMDGPIISQLTWQGHELLDAIRDPEAWRRTKEGARKVGSESLDFMWGLAKAYGKQLAKEKLGIELP